MAISSTARARADEDKITELNCLIAKISGENAAFLIQTDAFVRQAVMNALCRAVEKDFNSSEKVIVLSSDNSRSL